ncbi:MAG: type II secretion system protein, partial [Gammaproteobacteria bacterium]|nr:type II secretion system protein [Gammaproteobacteria bacterium]
MKLITSKTLNEGFTLIEMAVVLVIVGILLGSFIGTLTSRINVTKKSDAIEELNEIKQSMMAYAFVNGYLPCPDCDTVNGACTLALVGDGIADYTGASCSKNDTAGNVPWVTLGLGRGDPWGNHYRYAVQNEYADESNPFELDSSSGTAKIREPDFVADVTGATWHSLADNVVAIIFSHGSNGYGAINEDNLAGPAIPAANTDELENTDGDADYYMRPETSAETSIAGKEFDDIVVWISEYELKA